MIALIVVGIESAGNRIACSLLSKATFRGEPMLGSDLAGLDDGVAKYHDDEAFDRAWKGEATIESIARGRPFVTSRSYPCAGEWPDAVAFARACEQLGYDARTIVVVRDMTAVDRSCARAGHGRDHAEKWARLERLALGRGIRPHWLDYEAMVALRSGYLRPWLADVSPLLRLDDSWAERLVDGNAKHWGDAP